MSLVVSSTTDDQAAVNAAAGIEPPPVEEQTVKTPPKPAELEEPDEETEEPEPDENGDEDDPEDKAKPPAPKRLGGWQRKIQQLTRQNEELARRYHEAVYQRPPQPQVQSPQPKAAEGPPVQEAYESYDAYMRDVARWEVRQEMRSEREADARRQAQQQEQEQLRTYRQRLAQQQAEMPDYDDVIHAVDDIVLPEPLSQAIRRDALGPRLAYELAKQPEFLEQIAAMHPLDGLTSLGEFRAGLGLKKPEAAKAAPRNDTAVSKRTPVSQAPAPIRPIAGGANGTSTVPPDQMPLADYIKWRERTSKAGKR